MIGYGVAKDKWLAEAYAKTNKSPMIVMSEPCPPIICHVSPVHATVTRDLPGMRPGTGVHKWGVRGAAGRRVRDKCRQLSPGPLSSSSLHALLYPLALTRLCSEARGSSWRATAT